MIGVKIKSIDWMLYSEYCMQWIDLIFGLRRCVWPADQTLNKKINFKVESFLEVMEIDLHSIWVKNLNKRKALEWHNNKIYYR